MDRKRFTSFLYLCAFPVIMGMEAGAESPVVESSEHAPVSFAKQILPILSDKCFACHGPDTADEGLVRLDSFEAATADLGGYRAINVREANASELIARIDSEVDPMPPRDSEKQLTEEQKELLRVWVRQGGQYEQHWAFVPPVKTAVVGGSAPAIQEVGDVTGQNRASNNAIDYFVNRELERQGVDLAKQADRATLARRVALALTGLPPEVEQLERFIEDDRQDAYVRFIEEVLASPRFGEHQARYWLDAVRYGDTHGLHLDNRRGIYPYRDWVVRAFNKNLPLDEFLTWQVAGDLLPNPSLEQLTATGFVRLNPSTGEGGAIGEEFQAKNNFDRTETLGTVLLGMSLVCARCHTHKYDPIPQQEYYQLMAFFNSTAEPPLDGNSYTYGDTVKVPRDQAEWARWEQMLNDKSQLFDLADETFSDEQTWQQLLLFAKQQIEASAPPESAPEGEASLDPWTEVSKANAWIAMPPNLRLEVIANAEGVFDESQRNRAREILQFEAEAEKTFTTTLVARDLPTPRSTRVLRRGEYDMPIGEPVQPGVLSALGAMEEDAPRNRLGLAKWLTSRKNPVVARVLVNRYWQQVFGYGLVRTPEDFGLQGEQPTHPELLDWLAVELQDSGWDVKHMLRLMVSSQTFQQSSAWRSDLNDPDNRLLARGPSYRLDAEVIRDIGLWSSGLLDPHLGGEGVKPYQPDGMWKALAHPGSNTKQYVKDSGALLYRRSLYIYWKRTSPHPMMTLFDAPDRESSCVRRSRTNTSLQSLGLFNETQRIEIGRKLAERLLREDEESEQRLDLLFKLLASRSPSETEQQVCLKLYQQLHERYASTEADAIALLSIGDAAFDRSLNVVELAAWTQVCVTLLASDLALTLY